MKKGYNKNLIAIIFALLFILVALVVSRPQVIAKSLKFKNTGSFCSLDNPGACIR